MGKIQFLMDTDGHCFLCLQPATSAISTSNNGGDPPEEEVEEIITISPKIVSFRNMCQYLRINIKEVSNEANPISSSISSSSSSVLECSELKGALCGGCVPHFELFRKRFLELEEANMKMEYSLKSIYDIMMAADSKAGKDWREFQKQMLIRQQSALRNKFVEQLRRKTVQRCSTMIERMHVEAQAAAAPPSPPPQIMDTDTSSTTALVEAAAIPIPIVDPGTGTEQTFQFELPPNLQEGDMVILLPQGQDMSGAEMEMNLQSFVQSQGQQDQVMSEEGMMNLQTFVQPPQDCPAQDQVMSEAMDIQTFVQSQNPEDMPEGIDLQGYIQPPPPQGSENPETFIFTTTETESSQMDRSTSEPEGQPEVNVLQQQTENNLSSSSIQIQTNQETAAVAVVVPETDTTTATATVAIAAAPPTTKKKFKCDRCDKRFGTFGGLQNHQQSGSHEPKTFKCTYCKKPFTVAFVRNRHMQLHCPVRFPPPGNANGGPDDGQPLLLENSYKCYVCHKIFPLHSELEHEKLHHHGKKTLCKPCNIKLLERFEEINRRKRQRSGNKQNGQGQKQKQVRIDPDAVSTKKKKQKQIDVLLPLLPSVAVAGTSSASMNMDNSDDDSDIQILSPPPSPSKKTATKTTKHDCDICRRKFKSRKELYEHQIGGDQHPGMRFGCELCFRTFALRFKMDRHKQTCLGGGEGEAGGGGSSPSPKKNTVTTPTPPQVSLGGGNSASPKKNAVTTPTPPQVSLGGGNSASPKKKKTPTPTSPRPPPPKRPGPRSQTQTIVIDHKRGLDVTWRGRTTGGGYLEENTPKEDSSSSAAEANASILRDALLLPPPAEPAESAPPVTPTAVAAVVVPDEGPVVITLENGFYMETCTLCSKQFHSKRMMRRHLAANHPEAKDKYEQEADTTLRKINGPYKSLVNGDASVVADTDSPVPRANLGQSATATTPTTAKKRPYNRKSKTTGEDKSNQTEVECGVCQEKVSDPSTHKCSLLETTLKLNSKGEVIGQIVRPKLPRLIIIDAISSPSNNSKSPPTSTLNPKTGWHQCTVCGKEFPRERTFQHHYKSIHLQSRLQCNLCGKEFHHRSEYNRHHRDTHMGIRFKCDRDLCDKSFPLMSSLLEHLQSAHPNDEPNGGMTEEEEDDGGDEQPQAHCSTATPKKRGRPRSSATPKKSNNIQSPPPSADEASPPPSRNLSISPQRQQNGGVEDSPPTQPPKKVYRCNICDKVFSHKSNLGTHRQSVHYGASFPCPNCPKSFRSSSNRRQHLRLNRCTAGKVEGQGQGGEEGSQVSNGEVS